MDFIERAVRVDGEVVNLLLREYALLTFFMRRAEQVVTRDMLLTEVWRCNFLPQTNLIDVHLGKLRRKIDGNCPLTSATLFAPDGLVVTGALVARPDHLPIDGRVHRVTVMFAGRPEVALAAAELLPDGQVLVVQRSAAILAELRRAVLRALPLGLVPLALLGLIAGTMLSLRTMHEAIERIMRGNLSERLPGSGPKDDLDQLSDGLNRMLDEIERLLGEVKSVGDNIAHDLRTPLTRMRMRLESARRGAHAGDGDALIESCLTDLDYSFGLVTALLRIAEIEAGRRKAGFRDVDLSEVAEEVGEIYAPIAAAQDQALTVDAPPGARSPADHDLLIEVVANIVDNAIKLSMRGQPQPMKLQGRRYEQVYRYFAVVLSLAPGLALAGEGNGEPFANNEAVLSTRTADPFPNPSYAGPDVGSNQYPHAADRPGTNLTALDNEVLPTNGSNGPLLGADYSTSITLVKRLMDGAVPGCPRLCLGVVDVADLHLRAMTDAAANGQRFLAVASDFIMARDLARMLKARMGGAGRRVPTREIPDWLPRLSAVFDREVKQVLPDLGKRKNAASGKARRMLGWAPRPAEDAIVAAAESLVQLGLLRNPASVQG